MMRNQTHQEFLNTKYFSSLNGIRCLAILFVIGFHHNGNYLVQGIKNFGLNQIFLHGNLGVNLFFVVSGFLITTLLLREQRQHQTIFVKLFYARRALRIFPLYYTTLLIYALLLVPYFESNPLRQTDFYHNLPAYITYTSNWFVEKSSAIFVIAWSLATEEQFYLVWPNILKVFKKWGAVIFIGLIIVLNQLAAFNILSPIQFLSESQNHFLFRVIGHLSTPIGLGVLLAFGLNSKAVYEKLFIIKNKTTSCLWFAVMLLCIYYPQELTAVWHLIINMSMMLFVGSCVYREDHVLAKILNSKVFFRIGEVSYGMYLFQIFCLFIARSVFQLMHWINPYFELVLSLVLVFVLASLSYAYYERQFLSLKTLCQPHR